MFIGLIQTVNSSFGVLNYMHPGRQDAKMGLLDPAISDDRVIFFLPTPSQAQLIRLPRFPGNRVPQRKIFAGYLKKSVTISLRISKFGWVMYLVVHGAGWDFVRNLGGKYRRSSLEPYVSDNGLLTIAGGRWTSYRTMAEETIDTAIKSSGLSGKVEEWLYNRCSKIGRSCRWSRNMFIGLIQTVNSFFFLRVTVLDYMHRY